LPSILAAKVAAFAAAILLLAGCASGPSVPPTGETTEVTVTVSGMLYVPNVIEVPLGNRLVVTFENTGTDFHDLQFDNNVSSIRLAPGDSQVLDVGVISTDLDGWCTVGNHRAMGMELVVLAVD
jgi:nitrite reductase (NO-forming)